MSAAQGVYIHTLGCPKNEADSDALSARLEAAGVAVVSEPDAAAYLLVNTCGFIEDAREESIAAILEAADAYPGTELLVMGCLVERYRSELEEGLPEVGGWFGLADTGALVQRLAEAAGRGPGSTAQGARGVSEAGLPRRSYAYIKISDGCDHGCSFCAIPQIKGPYHAAPVEEIMEAVRLALAEGVRELILVGQDTAVWRQGKLDLTGLVDMIARDPRVARIRLMYLQPEHVTDGLLRTMAFHEKLCRYLDIPFQHASRPVLRRMQRRGEAESYQALLLRARRFMPDVSIRTTFIVGFPGETEDDVDALVDFIETAAFEHAGVFAYCPEEGTPAALLTPLVPDHVVRDRLARIGGALSDAAERSIAGRVGDVTEVLIDSLVVDEGPEDTYAIGRTRGQAPEVDGVTYLVGRRPPGLAAGDLTRIRIVESIGYDLVGESVAADERP